MLQRFILPRADVGQGIRPSSGAKLYFYEPSTTTLKVTYTDVDGLIPSANPVESDSAGLFQSIFMSGTYKIVLQDKNGSQIWEVDDVEYLSRISNDLTATLEEVESGEGIITGSFVTVLSLGNAKFLVEEDVEALPGDIEIEDGRVAVLQEGSDGKYNVTWFGAAPDPTDQNVQDTQFALAASRTADTSYIVIPAGRFKLQTAVPTATQWELLPGAEIIGLGGVSPTFATDTTYLTGTMIRYQSSKKSAQIYVGETDYAAQKLRGKGLGNTITGISASGNGGLLGASISSKSDTENQSCIGVSAIIINDNTNVARTAWGIYSETVQDTGAGGNTFGWENAIANKNQFVSSQPNQGAGYGDGYTVGDWCSVGIGGATEDVTAWKACISVGGQFDKGMIVYNGSIKSGLSYKELFATEQNCAWVWYPTKGIENDHKPMAYLKATDNGVGSGNMRFVVNDVINEISSTWVLNTTYFGPGVNNAFNMGSSGVRLKTIYLTNSPDVSSDETLKNLRDESGELSESELLAGSAIARLPRIFKWISEVELKGEDDSYLHCSPMAQSVWQAFIAQGLNPENYGFINNGSDTEKWSLQPQELLWLICASQQNQIDEINKKLDSL